MPGTKMQAKNQHSMTKVWLNTMPQAENRNFYGIVIKVYAELLCFEELEWCRKLKVYAT